MERLDECSRDLPSARQAAIPWLISRDPCEMVVFRADTVSMAWPMRLM